MFDTVPDARAPVALVTGGTGFLGAHLVNRLIHDGWHVHVVSRRPPADGPGVRYHRSGDAMAAWDALLQSVRPQVVFHLATLFVAEHRADQVDELIDTNLKLGCRLLDAMDRAGTRRLVNAASTWQHREPGSPDPHPVNLYAATKQAFEGIVDYYAELRGLSAVSLRLFDTYGPQDRRPKLINLLLRLSADAPPLALSAGEQRLCLVHVQDGVEALMAAAAHTASASSGHARLGLGGVPQRSLREIVALLEALRGQRLPVQWGARPYRVNEVMLPWHALHPLPGWQPRIRLEEGLAALVAAGP